ncbi:MAG: LysE family translocator [Desulfobacterales bacterium]|nr:LysE family translocator [Desulfobacterales bacterium]
MEIQYLLKGIVIGVSIAAPVGPVGLLCIKRSLNHGFLAGFVTGLGAAAADAFYGFAAGFSLTCITDFLLNINARLHIIGGLFLSFLGLTTVKKKASGFQNSDAPFSGYVGCFVSTLFFTLTNPLTIMAFMGIFSGLGIGGANNGYAASATLVGGVFSGSALWWLTLASVTAMAGKSLNHGFTGKINIVAGSILIFFGVWALAIGLYGIWQCLEESQNCLTLYCLLDRNTSK